MDITRKNILLADDEDFYRELLTEEIPRETSVKLTDISTATSGAEAISLLESGHTFDLQRNFFWA